MILLVVLAAALPAGSFDGPPLIYGRGPAAAPAERLADAGLDARARDVPVQKRLPPRPAGARHGLASASFVLLPDASVEPAGEALRDAAASTPNPPSEGKPPEVDADRVTADDSSIPVVHVGRAGWVKTAASLLLYDSSGTLVNEIGLGTWSEPAGDGTTLRRTVRGGISKDGRYAWSWEKAESVKEGRNEKPVTTARLMRYLATNGDELFRNELADAPPGLDPVAVADDGERLLLAERGPDAWILAAFHFSGLRLVDAHGKGVIELMQLSANGDFALVRWHQLDHPPEYSYLKLADRVSGPVTIKGVGVQPKLTNEGRVLVGGKVVYPK